MTARVYKAHAGRFSVCSDEEIFTVGAKGTLKRRGGIVAGDAVRVENGTIVEVLPRKNRIERPNAANVDVLAIVVSATPKPDFLLADKLAVNAFYAGMKVTFVVNKSDIDDGLFEKVKEEYKGIGESARFLKVSAKSGEGIDGLKAALKGKLTLLAGQSAAGKTSIINAVFGADCKVGSLSEKICRGKHTTTRSEIFAKDGLMIMDSPGFAVIDAAAKNGELSDYYPEYAFVSGECRFRGCAHVNEPDCMVKKLVESGKFSAGRYKRYLEIYDEIKRRRQYE